MQTESLVRRFAVPVVLLVALSAGGLAMCGLPGDSLEDGVGIAGTYVVNGTDPLGTEYSGTVTITPGEDLDTFTIEWILTGTIQTGVARQAGNRLDVEWRTVSSPQGPTEGTATYTIGTDGTLRGTRTVNGADGVGTEEIFPEP